MLLMLLMPDHLHAVIAFPANAAMKETLARWKRFVPSKYDIRWQRDFFDHRLRNAQEETEKISYILMNPVRRGLCGKPDHWPWILRPNDRPPPVLGQ